MKDVREANVAVASGSGSGRGRAPGAGAGRGGGAGVGRGSGRGSAHVPMATVKCYLCKEIGHYKGDCPKTVGGLRGRGGGSAPRGDSTPRGVLTPGRPSRKRARSNGQPIPGDARAPAPGRAPKDQRVEWGATE